MDVIYEVFDLTTDGRGVARQPNGRIVFITGALPGDKVIAHIHQAEVKGPLSGWVEEVIVASPHRVEHPCPHFRDGCIASPLGALQYERALDLKQRSVTEVLKRIGRIAEPPVAPIIPSPDPWGYRDRVELALEWNDSAWLTGYRSLDNLIPIQDCLLTSQPVRNALIRIAELLANGELPAPEGRWQGGMRLLLRDNGNNGAVAVLFVIAQRAVSVEPLENLLNRADLAGWQIRRAKNVNSRLFASVLETEAGNSSVAIPMGSQMMSMAPVAFAQANRSAADTMLEKILEFVPTDANLLDLYGGFGFFGLHHALRGGRATVVESSQDAITNGLAFATEKGLPVHYIVSNLDRPNSLRTNLNHFNVILLDPPRKGAHRHILSQINRKGPGTLIYVSCHAAALARDLERLPMYRPVRFFPVDLFPQTPDVEVVAVFERKLKHRE